MKFKVSRANKTVREERRRNSRNSAPRLRKGSNAEPYRYHAVKWLKSSKFRKPMEVQLPERFKRRIRSSASPNRRERKVFFREAFRELWENNWAGILILGVVVFVILLGQVLGGGK